MATTTPNYGWPVPTSTDYVKDGATAIEALGDAIDATVFGLPSGGLTLISSTTIGTAVASVTVTGAFSATYDNYKIIIANTAHSVNGEMKFTLNNSTGSTYSHAGRYENYAGANVFFGSAATGFWLSAITSTVNNSVVYEIQNPFLTEETLYQALYNSNSFVGSTCGIDTNVASQTGFTVATASGTMTGGKIKVYGYKN
jgi:hypothetical protein